MIAGPKAAHACGPQMAGISRELDPAWPCPVAGANHTIYGKGTMLGEVAVEPAAEHLAQGPRRAACAFPLPSACSVCTADPAVLPPNHILWGPVHRSASCCAEAPGLIRSPPPRLLLLPPCGALPPLSNSLLSPMLGQTWTLLPGLTTASLPRPPVAPGPQF